MGVWRDCLFCDGRGCARCNGTGEEPPTKAEMERMHAEALDTLATVNPNIPEGDISDLDEDIQKEIIEARKKKMRVAVDNETPSAELWRRSIR